MAEETTAQTSGLSAKQKFELGQAASRREAGTATKTDITNLDYAKSQFGFDASPINKGATATTSANIDVTSGSDQVVTGSSDSPLTINAQETGNAAADAATRGQQALEQEKQTAKTEQARIKEEESRASLAGEIDAQKGASEASLRAFQKEFEINKKQQRVAEIDTQINQLKESLNLGKIAIEGQVIPMEFITGQQALLERQGAAKISALSSQAAVVQNQLNFAVQQVQMYYQASEADRTNRINNLKLLLDYDRQDYIRLDDKERDITLKQIDLEVQKGDKEQAQKERIQNLMLENPEVWGRANVSLDMDVEDIITAMTKVAPVIESEQQAKQLVDTYIKAYPDAGILPTDSLAIAVEKLKLSPMYKKQISTASAGGGGSLDKWEAQWAMQSEFMADVGAGMPYEDAVKRYGVQLGTDFVAAAYGKNISPLDELLQGGFKVDSKGNVIQIPTLEEAQKEADAVGIGDFFKSFIPGGTTPTEVAAKGLQQFLE